MNVKILLCLITLSCNCIHSLASDFNGSGTDDIAIFRPSTGLWAVRGVTRCYYGKEEDIPSPGDYDGDGITNIAVFRPATGLWAVRNISRLYFGKQGDMPIAGGTRRLYNPDIFQIDKESGIVRVGYNTQNSGFTVGREPEWPDWPYGIGHNVIFHGNETSGDSRLIWDSNRGALRFGGMYYYSQWDEETPGAYSLSVGLDSVAKGGGSAAIGANVRTINGSSLAVGNFVTAGGPDSIAVGSYVYTDGWQSMAFGSCISAQTDNAIVIGKGAGYGSFPYGLINDIPDSLMDGFNTDTDPALFVDSYGVGIGTTSPARKLHVNDVMRLEPRSTAPDNPSQGDLYFDSTDAKLKCYDGSFWQDLF